MKIRACFYSPTTKKYYEDVNEVRNIDEGIDNAKINIRKANGDIRLINTHYEIVKR